MSKNMKTYQDFDKILALIMVLQRENTESILIP